MERGQGRKFLLTLRRKCGIIPVVQVCRLNLSIGYASVAQSVEQLIRNQQVRCSSHPTSSTKRPENSCFRGVLLYTGQRTGWEFPIRCAVLCCFLAWAMRCPMACAASSCLWRVVQLQLCPVCRAAKTGFLMGIDHAYCLQVGVNDDCPHELHASAL